MDRSSCDRESSEEEPGTRGVSISLEGLEVRTHYQWDIYWRGAAAEDYLGKPSCLRSVQNRHRRHKEGRMTLPARNANCQNQTLRQRLLSVRSCLRS